MEREDEYINHVKDCWELSIKATTSLGCVAGGSITYTIFDKILTPYHYFIKGQKTPSTEKQPPTDKQIGYAKQLGITNPEQYSKNELSKKIEEKQNET